MRKRSQPSTLAFIPLSGGGMIAITARLGLFKFWLIIDDNNIVAPEHDVDEEFGPSTNKKRPSRELKDLYNAANIYMSYKEVNIHFK